MIEKVKEYLQKHGLTENYSVTRTGKVTGPKGGNYKVIDQEDYTSDKNPVLQRINKKGNLESSYVEITPEKQIPSKNPNSTADTIAKRTEVHQQGLTDLRTGFSNVIKIFEGIKVKAPNKYNLYAIFDGVANGDVNKAYDVPKGFIAYDVKTGRRVSQVLTDENGLFGIEYKSGYSGLTKNQNAVYPEAAKGLGTLHSSKVPPNSVAPRNIYIFTRDPN